MGAVIFLIYFGMGVAQFFAIIAGVQEWWGIHWAFSGFIALVLAGLPIIGTITGIMGAVNAWDWSYTAAILFFCWPYAIYILVAIFFGVSTLFSAGRKASA